MTAAILCHPYDIDTSKYKTSTAEQADPKEES